MVPPQLFATTVVFAVLLGCGSKKPCPTGGTHLEWTNQVPGGPKNSNFASPSESQSCFPDATGVDTRVGYSVEDCAGRQASGLQLDFIGKALTPATFQFNSDVDGGFAKVCYTEADSWGDHPAQNEKTWCFTSGQLTVEMIDAGFSTFTVDGTMKQSEYPNDPEIDAHGAGAFRMPERVCSFGG